jgi:hypothetical protein
MIFIILENIYNRIDEIEEMLTETVLASTFGWYGIVKQMMLQQRLTGVMLRGLV